MTLNQSQPVREILKFPKLNKNYFIRSGQGSSSRYKVRFQGFHQLTLLIIYVLHLWQSVRTQLLSFYAATNSESSDDFIFHEFFLGNCGTVVFCSVLADLTSWLIIFSRSWSWDGLPRKLWEHHRGHLLPPHLPRHQLPHRHQHVHRCHPWELQPGHGGCDGKVSR